MKGLLRKDLQLIWASWPILLMILVCGTGISVYIQQPTMEICFVTLLLVFQTVATVMNDQTSGWFPWELTLPVSPKHILYEKFVLALIVLGFGACLALLIYWGVSAITHVTIDRFFAGNQPRDPSCRHEYRVGRQNQRGVHDPGRHRHGSLFRDHGHQPENRHRLAESKHVVKRGPKRAAFLRTDVHGNRDDS